MKLRCTDERYSQTSEAFEYESVDAAVAEMEPNFKTWADEQWDRMDDIERSVTERDAFIASRLAMMRREFADSMESADDDE